MSKRSKPLTITRRKVLKSGAVGAGAAFLASGCGPAGPASTTSPGAFRPVIDRDAYDGAQTVAFSPDDVPVDETRFGLGVSAGAVRARSAALWTHSEGNGETHALCWRDGDSSGEIKVVHDAAVALDAFSNARVELDALAPDTVYHYAFFDAEKTVRSVVGTVRTAFVTGTLAPLTIGCMTCTNARNAPYTTLDRFADVSLDALVHVGDMSYNDGAVTADDYAEVWSSTLRDPGYRSVLPQAGLYFTWDDHEVTNNLNPETIDPVQLETARQSCFSFLPTAQNGRELYDSFRWGNTAEFIVLDGRSKRRPSQKEDPFAYLGLAQTEFLEAALLESPCHFKVILNSVPVTQMTDVWLLQGDRWQGYAAARERLLSFLKDNEIRRVVFLSGDFHVGFISRVESSGFARSLYEVAVGPSGNLGNPLGFLAESPDTREQVFPAEQFLYGKGALAATTLTFDPVNDVVRVQFIDGATGELLTDTRLTEWEAT